MLRVQCRICVRLDPLDFPPEHSTVDALSLRLASELLRRHPHDHWLNQGHPGGGIYVCLMIGSGSNMPNLMLNREGRIQVPGGSTGAGAIGAPPRGSSTFVPTPRHFCSRWRHLRDFLPSHRQTASTVRCCSTGVSRHAFRLARECRSPQQVRNYLEVRSRPRPLTRCVPGRSSCVPHRRP